MPKLHVTKGTTSKLIRIFVSDASKGDGSGLTGLAFDSGSLTAYYIREGASSATAITLVTMTLGTWASGGFIVVDGTNLPGCYEVGLPDAALATGASSVLVMLKGATNMAPVVLEIQLIDSEVAPVEVNLGLLKQSTNVHLLIGPLIDLETGAPITSVTLGNITAARVTQTGSTVSRTGVTLAASGTNQFTHVGDGYYEFDMSTTDTGMLGRVTFTFRDDDLFHPVSAVAQVVPANVWDSWVAGSDTLQADVQEWLGVAVTASAGDVPDVNVVEIAGDSDDAADLGAAIDNTNNVVKSNVQYVSDDATAAVNLEAAHDGTGYAGGTTLQRVALAGFDESTDEITGVLSRMLGSSSNAGQSSFVVDDTTVTPTTTEFAAETISGGGAINDLYIGRRVLFTTGAMRGSAYEITDYVAVNFKFTVSTMPIEPADGTDFLII